MKLIDLLIRLTIVAFILFAGFVLIMSFLGYEPAVIISGSMRPKMPTGSICFIDKSHPFDEYRVGDIIVYNSKGRKVVHRIVEKTEDGYRTKGDSNINVDAVLITNDIYYGKCILYIPYVGLVVMAFQSTQGKIILFLLLLLSLTAFFMIHDLKKNINTDNNQNNS